RRAHDQPDKLIGTTGAARTNGRRRPKAHPMATAGRIDKPAAGGDIVVIGAGLAGLFTALKLAPLPVTLVSPVPLGDGASSAWAQGGIAAAVSEHDSPEP